jgi:hypothetical protein
VWKATFVTIVRFVTKGSAAVNFVRTDTRRAGVREALIKYDYLPQRREGVKKNVDESTGKIFASLRLGGGTSYSELP